MMNVKTKVLEGKFVLGQGHLKRTTKEENMNKSEIWLPRVAAQKNGNNVCVKCLLASKAKSFTFFVTGGCVTHRSARLLFIVVGVVYLKELLMCLN